METKIDREVAPNSARSQLGYVLINIVAFGLEAMRFALIMLAVLGFCVVGSEVIDLLEALT